MKGARDFLIANQPLPDAKDVSQEALTSFVAIIDEFDSTPDDGLIPLLLGAMGDGFGAGTYQVLSHMLAERPRDVLESPLKGAFASPHAGTRFSAASVAAGTHDEVYASSLVKLLDDVDADVRWAATSAMASMPCPIVDRAFRSHIERFRDESVGEPSDSFDSVAVTAKAGPGRE
ncbi:MAG: HEAT repeat domain-containing protein [Phycisphaerales bacterium]